MADSSNRVWTVTGPGSVPLTSSQLSLTVVGPVKVFTAVNRYGAGLPNVLRFVVGLSLVALFVYASWVLIERPILRWKFNLDVTPQENVAIGSFSPPIDGRWTWDDARTLVFTPAQDLPPLRLLQGVQQGTRLEKV